LEFPNAERNMVKCELITPESTAPQAEVKLGDEEEEEWHMAINSLVKYECMFLHSKNSNHNLSMFTNIS
jgi:hypothetical protein